MPNAADIQWFKKQFAAPINAALAGTPFDLDMLTGLACQETGEIWPVLRKKGLSTDRILALCVGDTLDRKSTFPKDKDELVAHEPDGQKMFDIARQALVDMAQYIPGYQKVAKNPRKFCHGFGLFQYDIQFFKKTDPAYFLERKYETLDGTLGKCLDELKAALKKLKWTKASLTDQEMAIVGIVYNTGGYDPKKGLKQGYKPEGGKYYGEALYDYIQLSRTVGISQAPATIAAPPSGHAILPPATPLSAEGHTYVVDTLSGTLRLRSEPRISKPPTANVIGDLPDGHPVRATGSDDVDGFREVETSLAGALLRGFVSVQYLKPAASGTPIPVTAPAAAPPQSGIVAVYMPRKEGTVTKRTELANAHSLNEPNQPSRLGTTADELRADLAGIIDWLAVDKAAHKRYQPRDGLTFCNIYAHDYCFLAGVYLPRVWWTPKALIRLNQGQAVEPLYGSTIEEVRANSLFRWLRDFGETFGWRQTGSLTKLQQAANQGGIGLIVARRKEEGRSGHIVAVVPETEDERARRDGSGEVTAPLQSQAGAVNFSYGTGQLNWWRGAQFAESAFWIHA